MAISSWITIITIRTNPCAIQYDYIYEVCEIDLGTLASISHAACSVAMVIADCSDLLRRVGAVRALGIAERVGVARSADLAGGAQRARRCVKVECEPCGVK
jgi:hypothetical protein